MYILLCNFPLEQYVQVTWEFLFGKVCTNHWVISQSVERTGNFPLEKRGKHWELPFRKAWKTIGKLAFFRKAWKALGSFPSLEKRGKYWGITTVCTNYWESILLQGISFLCKSVYKLL